MADGIGGTGLHKHSAASRGRLGGNQSVSVAPTLDSSRGVPSTTKRSLAPKSGIHSDTGLPHQGNARAVPALGRTAANAKPAVARPRIRGCQSQVACDFVNVIGR